MEAQSERGGTAQAIHEAIRSELQQSKARFSIKQTTSVEHGWRTEETRDIVVSLAPEHARNLTGVVVEAVCSLIDLGHIQRSKPIRDEALLGAAEKFVLETYGVSLVLSRVDYNGSAEAAVFVFEDAEHMRYSVACDRRTGARHIVRSAAPQKTPKPCVPPLELKLTRGQVKRLASEIQASRRLMVLQDGGALLVVGTIKHYEKRTFGTGAVLHARAVRQEIFDAVRDIMRKA